MKRIGLIIAAVIAIVIIFSGANFRIPETKTIKTPKGCGYTIIEAGRGIDCKGDTINIEKIHRALASR